MPQHPTVAETGFKGRCPRCGQGKLFHTSLMLRERCSVCELSFDFADAGDGPAFFAILLLGFTVMGAALIAEFKFNAPVWFHVVAWGLLTPVLAVGLLRVLKGLLIAQQFHTKAAQVSKHD